MDKTTERIKADAEAYALPMVWVNQNPKGEEQLFYEYISSTSYIAGATAEHAQNESVRLQLEAQDANVGILLSQKKELIEKAQKMADALNGLLEWHNTALGYGLGRRIEAAQEALEQWKGAGKEVDMKIDYKSRDWEKSKMRPASQAAVDAMKERWKAEGKRECQDCGLWFKSEGRCPECNPVG